MAVVATAKRPKLGRPKNIDPPKLFSTTLPTTTYRLLSALSEAQHRTKSEVLTDALRAYSRRFRRVIKPM